MIGVPVPATHATGPGRLVNGRSTQRPASAVSSPKRPVESRLAQLSSRRPTYNLTQCVVQAIFCGKPNIIVLEEVPR